MILLRRAVLVIVSVVLMLHTEERGIARVLLMLCILLLHLYLHPYRDGVTNQLETCSLLLLLLLAVVCTTYRAPYADEVQVTGSSYCIICQ